MNKGAEHSFIEEKGELGGAVINKESTGGTWSSKCNGFSLAQS